MDLKLAVVACALVGFAAADLPPYGPPPPAYHAPAHHAPAKAHHPTHPPKYDYSYGVAAEGYGKGANFGHSESRDGYKTSGSYTVDLPDGRKQTVTYVDNGDGLIAEVTYEGEAHFPEHVPAYKAAPVHHAPAYGPPPPVYH